MNTFNKPVVVVIPARGGSKRIPRKNVRAFDGVTLIERAIKVAQGCRSVTKVCIDTDDQEVAEIAMACGAEVPFLRECTTADDVPVSMTTSRFIERLYPDSKTADGPTVVQLMANCPFRTVEDVERLIGLWCDNEEKFSSLISCFSPLFCNPSWFKGLSAEQELRQPKLLACDLSGDDQMVLPSGAIWISSSRNLTKTRDFWAGKVFGAAIPWVSAIDIDVHEEFAVAEYISRGLGIVDS